MTRWVFALSVLVLVIQCPMRAQTAAFPTSSYQWEVLASTPAAAAAQVWVIRDDVTPAGRTLNSVTCAAASVAGGQTCKAPILSYPNGTHSATLVTVVNGVTSSPSNTVDFTYQTIAPPTPCSTPALTISVKSFTPIVAVGAQGNVAFQVLNASRPVVLEQVKFGTQVVGEQQGTDLRASMGMYFSVPRTPNEYSLTVYVKDTMGCEAVTVAQRLVTVQ